MPFDKKYDKVAAKEAWLKWARGERPDLPTISTLAADLKINPSWLYEKTAKWGREFREQLQGQLAQVGAPRRRKPPQAAQQPIPRGPKAGLNASSPPSPLVFTDEYRLARKLGKDAMSIAMQGLIDEATTGTGASRVSAIRELLDRAGLAKDKERKDEPSPYEDEDEGTLRARVLELLGSNTVLTSLLKGEPGTNPTTLQTTPLDRPITPLVSPSSKISGVGVEASPETVTSEHGVELGQRVADGGVVDVVGAGEVEPAPLRVMLT